MIWVQKKKVHRNRKTSQKSDKDNQPGLKNFAKYSGMGFQMIAIILIFYWAGSKLDERSASEKPIYTAILTILGVFVGLYISLKDFIIKKDGKTI